MFTLITFYHTFPITFCEFYVCNTIKMHLIKKHVKNVACDLKSTCTRITTIIHFGFF